MKIALDFHGVLADIHGALIPAYNERYGAEHTARYGRLLAYSDLTCWDMTQYTVAGRAIYDFFADERIHLSAPLVPYAQEVTRAWAEAGHELFVLTDSIMLPVIKDYIQEHYPHINPWTHLMRVTNGNKGAVAGALECTVLVDDYAPNLTGFVRAGLLLAAPYNATEHPYYPERRMADWLAVDRYVSFLCNGFESGYTVSKGTTYVPELI